MEVDELTIKMEDLKQRKVEIGHNLPFLKDAIKKIDNEISKLKKEQDGKQVSKEVI